MDEPLIHGEEPERSGMSEATRKQVKLVGIPEDKGEKTLGSGKTIFQYKADIEVDGVGMQEVNVSCWEAAGRDAFLAGKVLDGTEREWGGAIEYTVFAPREQKRAVVGGGWGGRQADPEAERVKQRSITLLSCLSTSANCLPEGERNALNVTKMAKELFDFVMKTAVSK